MKIVIDIPNDYAEQFYKNKCKDKFDSLATNEFGYVLRKAFEDAKPLPKHHGRLIEVNALLEHELFTFTRYTGIDDAPCEDASIIIDNAPTIIEGSDSE